MRARAPLLVFLSVASLVAGACSGNNPQPPKIVQGGWAWNPSVAGDMPLPVTWTGAAAPQQLPLLPGGDCGASGSVQALTVKGKAAYAVGTSVACSAGIPSMMPVAWHDGTVTRLELPAGWAHGTALAAAVVEDDAGKEHVYVAGATGDEFPLPTIWKDGVLATREPDLMLPGGYDAGLITSLVITTRYAIAGGVLHEAGSQPPVYLAVVWFLAPDFASGTVDPLLPPAGYGTTTTYGGTVSMAYDGLFVYSVATLMEGSLEKAVFWVDDAGVPMLGSGFGSSPWGMPTGIALVGEAPDITPYISGLLRSPTSRSTPVPVIWTPSATQVLSTAGEGGAGTGESIAVDRGWAFVSGESLGADPTNGTRFVSVPALWTNGNRADLPGLTARGGATVLQKPLFGWWKVPGAAAAIDWPYPGGFGEIIGPYQVAAGGSAVARTIVAIPP